MPRSRCRVPFPWWPAHRGSALGGQVAGADAAWCALQCKIAQAKLLQTVLGAALLMGIKERLYLSLKTLSAPAAAKAALVATR